MTQQFFLHPYHTVKFKVQTYKDTDTHETLQIHVLCIYSSAFMHELKTLTSHDNAKCVILFQPLGGSLSACSCRTLICK